MKVCHVTSSHNRYDGRIFHKECISLSKNYEVSLLCSDGLKNENKNGISIKSTKGNTKNRLHRFLLNPIKLKKLCLKENADVYHFHDPELISVASYLKKKNKIVIFDSHEDNVNRISNRTWIPKIIRPLVKKIYEKKERTIFSKIDGVITVTEHIYKRIKQINTNTIIITNFPILSEYKSKTSKKNILCFAGGITKQYMHHNIISAIKHLDVEYKLAGKINSNYRDFLQKIEGVEKTEFVGLLDKEKLKEFYESSSIGMVLIDYVPNINYKEGSIGITKIFEYMMAGLPIIATDLEVWKEFVPNNCGICVNPNNIEEVKSAIEYLIKHPKEAKKMGEKGRKLVEEKYNWNSQEIILLAFYKKMEKKYEKNRK